MEYGNIYKLSKKFAPPKVDLRKAQILDDYGDESFSKLFVSHINPEDVKRKEFDYYISVYSFMEPEDLIFYLYPMLNEYKRDNKIEGIQSFMYSMDREIDNLILKLSREDKEVLKSALQEIWKIGNSNDFDEWYQCKNIQKFIGVTPQ